MSARFEELDHQATPLGDLVLRRRTFPGQDDPIYEITLGGAFLMSSLVCDSEVALARLALEARGEGKWSVLVGGLGLGYTAKAALDDDRVKDVTVVELLPEVIGWHERGLLPMGRQLVDAPHCRLQLDDFYGVMRQTGTPENAWDLVLIDIDHSPEALLHKAHANFYTEEGLTKARENVAPGGVFALWAGAAPDPVFQERLERVFDKTWIEEIRFLNPSIGREDLNTVYLARRGEGS